jgi:hypothetical protein
MVPVPVPTFEKLRFRFQLHILTQKKFVKLFTSLHIKLFYKEKFKNFSKFIVKCE